VSAWRVVKFGGAALRDGPLVARSLDVLARYGGERPLVVVSALAGVSRVLERATLAEPAGRRRAWDELRIRHRTLLRQLDLDGELLDRHLYELRGVLEALERFDRRRRDYVLSFGERMSARVVAAALRARGRDAAPLDAFDLGLQSDPLEGGLRREIRARRDELVGALERVPGIPVVTGFLARDRAGDLTTLGWNGSDLTAVWLGEALGAEEVQLWKTVSAVMTADPRRVPAARPLARLGWREAAELALHGAEVLHPGALEPALRARLPVRIRDVERPEAAGTSVEGESQGHGPLALAHRAPLARVEIAPGGAEPAGRALEALLATLVERGIEPYLWTLHEGASVLLPDDPRAHEALAASGTGEIRAQRGLATLAVVGPGAGADASLLHELVAALAAAGVASEPWPLGSPESAVLVVQEADLDRALRRVHAMLFERAPRPAPDVATPPS